MHKMKHVQCMYFPGNWRLWVRWGYLTCRNILPLHKYVNSVVAEHSFLTADMLKVSKCNTIITQSCLETQEHYFIWQLTTLCSECFSRSQAAWHLPLFQFVVSWGLCKLFQCIVVISGFKKVPEHFLSSQTCVTSNNYAVHCKLN
jgi:hypothetical protein